MQSTYSNLGKRFKELREKNNLTQEQVAELIGVEARQISRIENGKCFTTLENLEKMANIYKVEIKDFFNFEHFKSKEELIYAIVEMLKFASEENCKVVYRITKELIY